MQHSAVVLVTIYYGFMQFTVIVSELSVVLFVNLTDGFISFCLKVYVSYFFPILTIAREGYLKKL